MRMPVSLEMNSLGMVVGLRRVKRDNGGKATPRRAKGLLKKIQPVEAVYQRSDLLVTRRAMMQA
jgi:hypothetical protein